MSKEGEQSMSKFDSTVEKAVKAIGTVVTVVAAFAIITFASPTRRDWAWRTFLPDNYKKSKDFDATVAGGVAAMRDMENRKKAGLSSFPDAPAGEVQNRQVPAKIDTNMTIISMDPPSPPTR